jgi:hypothetical protein
LSFRPNGGIRVSADSSTTFFLTSVAKILTLLELGLGDTRVAMQNIGSKGLICKILWNKELAAELAGRNAATGLPLGFWFWVTMQVCAFLFSQ